MIFIAPHADEFLLVNRMGIFDDVSTHFVTVTDDNENVVIARFCQFVLILLCFPVFHCMSFNTGFSIYFGYERKQQKIYINK